MDENTIRNLKILENLTIEERELDLKIKALKELLVPLLPFGAKVETDNGIFTTESRKKYEYSEGTRERALSVKEDEKREIAEGIAIVTDGDPYLVYRAKKD